MTSPKPRTRAKSKFQSWRYKVGMNKAQAAFYFEVSLRTITNWDNSDAPDWAYRLIQITSRDLGGFHPSFRGISVKANGKMYLGARLAGGGNVGLSAEHLKHYPAVIRRLHELENNFHAQAAEIVHQARRINRALDDDWLRQEAEKRIRNRNTLNAPINSGDQLSLTD